MLLYSDCETRNPLSERIARRPGKGETAAGHDCPLGLAFARVAEFPDRPIQQILPGFAAAEHDGRAGQRGPSIRLGRGGLIQSADDIWIVPIIELGAGGYKGTHVGAVRFCFAAGRGLLLRFRLVVGGGRGPKES